MNEQTGRLCDILKKKDELLINFRIRNQRNELSNSLKWDLEM